MDSNKKYIRQDLQDYLDKRPSAGKRIAAGEKISPRNPAVNPV